MTNEKAITKNLIRNLSSISSSSSDVIVVLPRSRYIVERFEDNIENDFYTSTNTNNGKKGGEVLGHRTCDDRYNLIDFHNNYLTQ